jgi:hypothetical protein
VEVITKRSHLEASLVSEVIIESEVKCRVLPQVVEKNTPRSMDAGGMCKGIA